MTQQGYETSVALHNLDPRVRPDQRLFGSTTSACWSDGRGSRERSNLGGRSAAVLKCVFEASLRSHLRMRIGCALQTLVAYAS